MFCLSASVPAESGTREWLSLYENNLNDNLSIMKYVVCKYIGIRNKFVPRKALNVAIALCLCKNIETRLTQSP